MKKKLVVLSLAAVLAVPAFLFIQNRSNNSCSLIMENVEALANDEVKDLDKPVWERFYREDGGYNCAKPGNETC
ncbi:MAG: NVEALA domain-containing protein [Tepidanaerobacteraceae bacterium]|nr:NVEALA domain-containing protein [Tepidanaerobacteraceae bacterium]